jgi:hypothetical protein
MRAAIEKIRTRKRRFPNGPCWGPSNHTLQEIAAAIHGLRWAKLGGFAEAGQYGLATPELQR